MLRLVRDASGNLDIAFRVQFHSSAMRQAIKDEFAHLPVSRQRKYQHCSLRDCPRVVWRVAGHRLTVF
jgi:hypothetical protein